MWSYDRRRSLLNVTGDSFIADLRHVKKLIEIDQVPFLVNAIVHRVNGVDVPMVLVGHYLSEWLIAGVLPDYIWHFTTQALRKAG